jgi:hypothetical protein
MAILPLGSWDKDIHAVPNLEVYGATMLTSDFRAFLLISASTLAGLLRHNQRRVR